VAGLSLSTPSERFNPDWAPLIRQTADEISSAGLHPPPPAEPGHKKGAPRRPFSSCTKIRWTACAPPRRPSAGPPRSRASA
jgi:hypothetical protein